MAFVHKLSTLERALDLLKDEPLSGQEICGKVLSLKQATREMAECLAHTMLGSDPRFHRLPDGRWTVSGYGEKDEPLGLERATYVVVDVETTGFRPPADRVIEIGMVRVSQCRIVDSYETLINPQRPIPGPITSLTGISYDMLEDSPRFAQVCEEVVRFLGDAVFVAHNVSFDWRFIQSEIALASRGRLLNRKLCTKRLARRLLPEVDRRNLDELALFFNLSFLARHRALGDALVTAEILLRFIERACERGIATLPALFDSIKPLKLRKT